jgi:hypothetical protein
MARTILGTKLDNSETGTLSGTIRDENGVVVDLTAATVDVFLDYYRTDTNAGLNGRTNQQVVTAGVASNNHTVTSGGVITFKLTSPDTSIGLTTEQNVVARYTVQYQDGAAVARQAIQEIQFAVTPLVTVT